MIKRYGAAEMKSDIKGFTLIEIMVAMVIMGLTSIVIVNVYTNYTRVYATQEVAAALQQTLRGGIDIMLRDIRMVGFDPGESYSFGVEEATGTKIRVTADTNMNGILDESDLERITYNFDAESNQLQQILYEGTGSETAQPLIDNVDVSNSAFTYFDADGNDLGDPVAAANLANVRTVVISMTVQEQAGRGGMVDRSLSTRVICRNLGF